MRSNPAFENTPKRKGKTLWWVVPRAYWKGLISLLGVLVAWFAVMARFPRHRSATARMHFTLMGITALVPISLAGSTVYYAITREWAQGFLPDTLTIVPFRFAAVLSAAFLCVLPAVWVCQRKPVSSRGSAEVSPVSQD